MYSGALVEWMVHGERVEPRGLGRLEEDKPLATSQLNVDVVVMIIVQPRDSSRARREEGSARVPAKAPCGRHRLYSGKSFPRTNHFQVEPFPSQVISKESHSKSNHFQIKPFPSQVISKSSHFQVQSSQAESSHVKPGQSKSSRVKSSHSRRRELCS